MLELATKIIKIEEGFRSTPYHCSEGYPTVGYGLRIGYRDQFLGDFRDFPPMPEAVASAWLSEFLRDIVEGLEVKSDLEYLLELDPVRQAVVVSMIYQLGLSGVLKFRKTLGFIREGDYETAACEMLDSRWAAQTPERAKRHSLMMASGVPLEYYK